MIHWWQERVVYQIYPRSFQDSNGDGIGDIPGIISRLDDLADLGIGVLWLSPVYPSPNADNGYDISDYCGIHPDFGTMADMEALIDAAGRRNMKIIMDLVINHTSDEHPWFQAARNPDSPYHDWYIWRPGKGRKPGTAADMPNNWTGFFGGRCWTFDDTAQAYYLHLFGHKQPDLNWRNPAVLAAVEQVLRFWLDKGIAGFRCDVINLLWKASLGDGRRKLILTGSEHYLTREGTHEILRTLRREVLDQYTCFTVGETVFVTPEQGRNLCLPERRELNLIFSFEHMETDQWIVKWFKRRFHAGRLGRVLARWQEALPWNANYLENHDQPRSVSRFGDADRYWAQSAKLLCVLLMTLRGTPFVYQGQEIGMTAFDFTSMDEVRDLESHSIDALLASLHVPKWLRWRIIRATSRDNARTPMQWSAEPQAGFTTGTPWLAVNHNHDRINVAAQRNDPDSIRAFYKRMIALRAGNRVLLEGSFHPLVSRRGFLAWRREHDGDSLTVLMNLSGRFRRVSCLGEVILSSTGRSAFDGVLQPWEAVVMRVGQVLTPLGSWCGPGVVRMAGEGLMSLRESRRSAPEQDPK